MKTGNNSRALEFYDKALPFFEKTGQAIGLGNVYQRKGDIYLGIGKMSMALEMYDKALPLFKKVNNFIGIANIYSSMGKIFFYFGKNSKALELYDDALHFFKKTEIPLGLSSTYRNMGELYFTTGENYKALAMYKKAFSFFKKVGCPEENGSIYTYMGALYFRIGNNFKALEMYNNALPFFEKAGVPIEKGNLYWRKGNLFFYTGNTRRALNMYEKALHLFKNSRQAIGQGNIFFSKGDIYASLGKYSKALDMYNRALSFFKTLKMPIGQGNAHLGKGRVYLMIGDNPSASKMFKKALSFYKYAEEPIGLGKTYQYIGDIHSSTNEYTKSLEMYQISLQYFKKVEAIELVSDALHRKAKALEKLEKPQEALVLFEEGITNLEKVRTQTSLSELKLDFLKRVYDQYEDTVLFMLEKNFHRRGFMYAESMRGRVFLDRMAEEWIKLEKGLSVSLKETRHKLLDKLSTLSKKIHKVASEKGESKIQKLNRLYRKAEEEFEELLIKIRSENPRFADVHYPQPITVQALQRDVLKKGEILVRYFISQEKTYVFLISQDKFKVVPIEIKEKEINSDAEQFLTALSQDNDNHFIRYGKALYEKLIKPLEEELTGYNDIIIVPDGRLETIPFESFIIDTKDDRPVFLLGKYRLKYIQSATVLSQLRKHYQRDRNTSSFIGFGDPVYTSKEPKEMKTEQPPVTATPQEMEEEVKIEDEIKEVHQNRYKRSGGNRNRLIKSGEEVTTIARFFEGNSQKAKVYTQEQATEENAKAPDMKDYDFIHFACHGMANDDFQCLILSQDIPGAKGDGYFTLNEIMNCDYNAKLIVLSACQTGSGKLERAEGVTGLTRAMMYAGTPAVVASLWEVDSPATKDLMIAFYRNMLKKDMDKAEALHQAKLELLRIKEYASPTYWSAFVLYGE